jgi:hypothetical protein
LLLKKTWLEWIVEAMKDLGGEASLTDLYERLRLIRQEPFSKEWKATVRKTIESHSSDSENFTEGSDDLFRSVSGKGAGIWSLRKLA